MPVKTQRNGLLVVVEVVGNVIKERPLDWLVVVMYQPLCSPNHQSWVEFQSALPRIQGRKPSRLFLNRVSNASWVWRSVPRSISPTIFSRDLELDQSQPAGNLRGELKQTLSCPINDLP